MTKLGQDENQDVVRPIISVEPVISSDELAQLRKANNDLEGRNYELRESVRQLRLQSAASESERDQYKREAKKLKGELEQYRTPPLVIGTIESLASDERVIVRSTTGPQFLSKVGENVKPADLIPGRQCALHPQSFVVVEVLPNKYDSFISGMEVEIAPNVRYSDVGGLDKQKVLLREAIELPLLKPQLFEKVGIEPPKGVLLVGPPGTGKTLLAKAVSRETNAAFIQVVGSELVQKYIGEGARLVRELFALAREKAPAIIFIDEIDAIGSSRSNDAYSAGDHEVNRTLMQLLSELDGFNTQGNVKIIAATNRMDILDQALLRPGRFDRIIEFPLPDEEGRRMILSIHTRKMHLDKTVSLEKIAKETPDMNGSELMAICVEAGMNAVRGERTKVRDEDFTLAIEAVKQGRKPKNMPLTDGMYS
ncbi:MAG TPA: proteasome-activating nucleotidase [Methanocorpusculum sp.]|nr:proteasome-activating nucleotidase [Methanocorpusculum sp.]HJJ51143.1 proteasome-activating nucleotidase [Methanocorpusculum sp.]